MALGVSGLREQQVQQLQMPPVRNSVMRVFHQRGDVLDRREHCAAVRVIRIHVRIDCAPASGPSRPDPSDVMAVAVCVSPTRHCIASTV